MDQRNVSSATKMAKLADLFYELNRDGNIKIDARRNFYSRGNQPFKPKISRRRMLILNRVKTASVQ